MGSAVEGGHSAGGEGSPVCRRRHTSLSGSARQCAGPTVARPGGTASRRPGARDALPPTAPLGTRVFRAASSTRATFTVLSNHLRFLDLPHSPSSSNQAEMRQAALWGPCGNQNVEPKAFKSFDGSQKPVTLGGLRRDQLSIFSASINASCGISTLPNWRMRFLPAFCFSRSLRLRVASPP